MGTGGDAGTEMTGTGRLRDGANDGRMMDGFDTGKDIGKVELRTSDDGLETAFGPRGVLESPPGLAVTVT